MNERISYMSEQDIVRAQQSFLSRVYAWMVGGLLLTGAAAWYVASSGAYYMIFANNLIFWGLIIGELVLVAVISSKIESMSKATAGGLFLLYSVLNGITLSAIFVIYTAESIQNVFFISAAMFGALSAFGFFTKRNLSGIGSFMFMGLIGVLIAGLINMFIGSSALDFAISIIGVIVFAGLTAWDTQKLKAMYSLQFENQEMAAKGAINGALMLYLDFINLFLFLLRLFGRRD